MGTGSSHSARQTSPARNTRRPGGVGNPQVPAGTRTGGGAPAAGGRAAIAPSLHSRPESAKQVVGTLTLRVITRYGGIGATRPGRVAGKGPVTDRAVRRGRRLGLRTPPRVPEDWSLWQPR